MISAFPGRFSPPVPTCFSLVAAGYFLEIALRVALRPDLWLVERVVVGGLTLALAGTFALAARLQWRQHVLLDPSEDGPRALEI
jgi:hypothetical protein